MRDLIVTAPKLLDYLDASSQTHFDDFKRLLDMAQIKYTINPCLVRGLDYYSLTVYEWVTDKLGTQNAICAGGRYNDLVAQLGGKPTYAVGFALGMERLIELVAAKNDIKSTPDVYLIAMGDATRQQGLLLAEELRDKLPNLSLQTDCSASNLKTQFKRADKSGAKIALILGDEEIKQKTIGVKYLREDKAQDNLPLAEVIKILDKGNCF
jgi:histidyl-tRNA synthetase